MGCSVGKIDGRKLKDSQDIDVTDIKIQTILQLNSNDKKAHKSGFSSTPRSSSKNRKHKRNDTNSGTRKKGDIRRKNSRTRNDRICNSKSAYDSKIAAKYDIKAVIGKGSYSRVLRVEHRISKQPYALKMIEAPAGRAAFEAELSVLRRLNNPNVIKLVEVFESDNKVYMVMELATGGSLLDRLETKGYLSDDDSRDVIQMVLNGVKYLHSLGITHRDLKPDNLLYYHPGKESKIMITDFSFASTRKPSGNPYMHTVCGTPQYIAPEIVARKPYTCAVDMWAVGIITYIVLCGAFPFDAEQDAQIFKLILRGKVQLTDPVWSDVSTEAQSLVRLLLRTDPARRPSAPAALQHEWFTRLSQHSPPSRGPPRGDRRSVRSIGSSRSGGSSSVRSLRVSGHRRVQAHHLEALSADPEVAHMI